MADAINVRQPINPGGNMKKIIIILIFLSSAQYVMAALAPQYQNKRDMDVMVAYLKEHPKLDSSVKTIDLPGYTIFFNNGCKAVFGRKSTEKPFGWVGPADPLEFKKLKCPAK